MNKLVTIFKIPELARKLGITLLFLVIYRIGYHIPLPIINQEQMLQWATGVSQGAFGQLFSLAAMFSGTNFDQTTIFGLGIMPYISASIIFQLLASVYPPLEKLQKEGESGRRKINEYTRYATVFICLLQSTVYVRYLAATTGPDGQGLVLPQYRDSLLALTTAVLIMTAGTIFLMWLGEQIDEYGIGNGISLIIMAGIVARIPKASVDLFFDQSGEGWKLKPFYVLGGSGASDISLEKLIVLIMLFVGVVVGVIAMTKAQRRIPTQSARHVRGRRVYGGTRQFLPLRVNQAGVMPVIFASSLLMLPFFFFRFLEGLFQGGWASALSSEFNRQGYLYNLCYIVLIYFFCYLWTGITFNPQDISNNLKDMGSFIPGYRPGRQTAEYLEQIMTRITYVGSAFLAIVAIIPSLISTTLHISPLVASFYGGTGLLIVVSVVLDLVQRINSHLVMRNYPGLTED
ncbi:MAG: preprotein translocase subunit SecY [Gemmataceae bacterium]|mgnify:CR=1 FL=1